MADEPQTTTDADLLARVRRISNLETRLESALEEIECAYDYEVDFALESGAVNEIRVAKRAVESSLRRVRGELQRLGVHVAIPPAGAVPS